MLKKSMKTKKKKSKNRSNLLKKFILLLMLAVFVAPALKSDAISFTEKEHGFVSVSTFASSEVEPDTASVSFSVETSAPTAQAAVKLNGEKTDKLLSSLKPLLSLDKQDTISTTSISVRPVYSYDRRGKRQFERYTMHNTINVKVKDIQNISKIIDTAVANNATDVSDIRFFVENEQLYSAALIKEATQKAESNAQMTASSLNKKLCGVKRISVNCSQHIDEMMGARSELVKSSRTQIEPQKVKMDIYVNADFYVK